ncbi:hypothetical protein E2C01_088055 [Portunus trituberculatus]|uniref:Uncharacterized protein n=1 Tax=Portunus trituberculatus TaxID=210409 RepID=A0A5B7J9R7_PORTR|nr:hypothetical protein [Portunus trituberculatus]
MYSISAHRTRIHRKNRCCDTRLKNVGRLSSVVCLVRRDEVDGLTRHKRARRSQRHNTTRTSADHHWPGER